VPNEKVNILDALSLAGDLTIYGKRDNVLLIRENPDGTKTPYRINLTNSDMMSSNSAYYLRQNDIVYVEPGKAKSVITDATLTRTYAILGTVLTLLVVIASRIKY
jgi:polysaccharide export outer membrane protein